MTVRADSPEQQTRKTPSTFFYYFTGLLAISVGVFLFLLDSVPAIEMLDPAALSVSRFVVGVPLILLGTYLILLTLRKPNHG
jgi:hypothetical protein